MIFRLVFWTFITFDSDHFHKKFEIDLVYNNV
jgi:hypothetical protein